jgi:hypothetical protein
MLRTLKYLSSGFLPMLLMAQEHPKVEIKQIPGAQMVVVTVSGKPFTTFLYPDSLEKPVLYPIYAPDGQIITRGFPLIPRPNEPTDHPHHIGLWFNYENVNGLDFWNNSFAIPFEKKHAYGWIKTDSLIQVKGGKSASLSYHAHWEDWQKNVLLNEVTLFVFSTNHGDWIIDRTCTLTALQDISFPDAKDGMLGLRVARELQIPATLPQQYVDNKGNLTHIAAHEDSVESGNYLTSEHKSGNEAWGTRGRWCLLFGKLGADSISIVIIDHPKNPGFPTYWHARGYGLFAANPLGESIFSNGKEALNFKLKKGASVIFRYRIVIASHKERLSNNSIEQLASEFTGN